MAPLSTPRAPLGEPLRQISRSISQSLTTRTSSNPVLLPREIPDDVYISIHQNTPLIPRAITYMTNLLTRTPVALAIPPPHNPLDHSSPLPKRQNANGIFAIPVSYGQPSSPSPGAVAGIVIGSVFGFLLILWILYTCFNLGGGGGFSFFGGGGTEVVEEEIIRRRSRSPRRRSRSETIEISKSRSPRRERVVVEEEVRRVSRHDPIDDIVEVIEENSSVTSPPRRASKRSSGFRTVDPAAYGGGGGRVRGVR